MTLRRYGARCLEYLRALFAKPSALSRRSPWFIEQFQDELEWQEAHAQRKRSQHE